MITLSDQYEMGLSIRPTAQPKFTKVNKKSDLSWQVKAHNWHKIKSTDCCTVHQNASDLNTVVSEVTNCNCSHFVELK